MKVYMYVPVYMYIYFYFNQSIQNMVKELQSNTKYESMHVRMTYKE